MNKKKLLTKKQKAYQLNISIRTLDRWIKQNKIIYYIFNGKYKKLQKLFIE